MTFQLFRWAYDLRGVSPLAKLLAMRVADTADVEGRSILNRADLVEWLGCSQIDLVDALAEMADLGVASYRHPGGDLVELKLPKFPKPQVSVSIASENGLAVYVFSIGTASKIGISINPDQRLMNLQGGSPTIVISAHFVAWGPERKIRTVERAAHARLSDVAMGREWFAAAPTACIAAVIEELAKVGISIDV